MSAHTPGPWKVIDHPRVALVHSQRSVGGGSNGMASVAWLTGGAVAQEANAHLIAAAPGLLAALEELCEQVRSGGPFDTLNARAAIAKARGGT